MSRNDEFTSTASGHGFFGLHSYLNSAPSAIAKFCADVVATGFDAGTEVTDITLRFFKTIESNGPLLQEYNRLKDSVGQWQLNAQIGRWVKDNYQLHNGPIADAKDSMLIKAYTTHSRS